LCAKNTCGSETNSREAQMERGRRVRIHGLKGRSDLNGKCGTIVQLVQSKGRWVVRLDSHTFDNYATAYPILKYGGDG
jgi:hypothetical protein